MKFHSKEELLKNLRKTTLNNDVNILPYKDAKIELKNLSIDSISPTSFYYFTDTVYKLTDLYDQLFLQNIDLFNLNGYVEFAVDDNNLVVTPPIIEKVNDDLLLVDGIHRVMLSYLLGKESIRCIIIDGAKPLTYAVSNPNGWKDVQAFKNEVPQGFKTRLRRYPDSVYRQYSRVFNFEGQVQIPRKHHLNKLQADQIILQKTTENIR